MTHALGTDISGLTRRLSRLDDDPAGLEWAGVEAAVGSAMHETASRIAGEAIADDAMQEALLLLRRNAGVFRRSGITADEEARRWCLRVAANAARKLSRGMRRRQRNEIQAGRHGMGPSDAPAPGAAIEAGELTEILHGLIARLPGPERRVIEQRLVDGLSAESVGTVTGHSVSTVRWRLRRALDHLRTGLRRAGYLVFALAVSLPRRALAAMSTPPAGSLHGLPASLMKGILMSTSFLITTSLVCALFTGAMATPASAAASTPATASTKRDIQGTVLAFDGTILTVGLANGGTERINVSRAAVYLPRMFKGKISDIKVGQRVYVVIQGGSTYVLIKDPYLWKLR